MSYHDHGQTVQVKRFQKVYIFPDWSRARRVWEGEWERHTRRDPQTPETRREWFRREIDFGATRRQGGEGLALRKIVNVDGGARIDPPRVTPEWVTVVRWVLFALILAEEEGATRDNVDEVVARESLPLAQLMKDERGRIGSALGLRPGWAVRVVKAVGNYGELFERNRTRLSVSPAVPHPVTNPRDFMFDVLLASNRLASGVGRDERGDFRRLTSLSSTRDAS